MAATHPVTIRNQLAAYVCGLVDAGSAAGKLVIQTSGGVTVATLTFTKPSFGAPASGVATANTITPDNNAAGGTMAKAVAQDSAGNVVFNCTISTPAAGGDITFANLTVTAGQIVELSSLTYTAPP